MKNILNELEGIYSLMLTPFKTDLSVDYDAYERYCAFQVSQGVKHLFAVCGSSEMSALTLEERLNLARLTVKNAPDTYVVATGNMEYDPAAQCEEVKRMTDTGVDALVFTTRGLGNNPDALVEHVARLKECTDLPIFMYEFPGLRPHLISGETYGRLVKECGVKGIKDTTCTKEGIKAKIDNKGYSCIIQANMPFLFEAFKMGARGVMSTPTACGGAFFQRFFDAFMSGDMSLAEKRYQEIMLLDCAIGDGFNATAKYLVSKQGSPMNYINRGGTVLSSQRLQALDAFFDWCCAQGLMKDSF
ncbi:MAG: dihydrodipicolinate synthase family protein [Clostridia bacterium]|nr:dihydrodipicolinate synthase family protein [Clostridia bacterium]